MINFPAVTLSIAEEVILGAGASWNTCEYL